MIAGCATEYAGYAEYEGDEAETESTYGSAQQAVNACVGDDLQYDFNGFTASLAVAIANELGRWDASTDFVVSGDRIALSATGNARCGTGCANLKDLLLLQGDASAGIPNHSPSVLRSKLVGWYNKEVARLAELALESKLPNGTYQFKNKNSGKNMVVDQSSLAEGALVEQGPLAGTAGDWISTVIGTKRQFKNKNSGKCLDLASASSADNVNIVQKTCSTAATQQFELVKIDGGMYGLKTTYGRAVSVFNWGTANDVRLVQTAFSPTNAFSQFTVNPTGGTSNPANSIFEAMYGLSFFNTDTMAGGAPMKMVMAPVAATEGSAVKIATYSASNQLHQWYAAQVGTKFQFINRGSEKCLALASDSATALLAIKTCANVDTQLFTAAAITTADYFSLVTKHNKFIEIQNALTTNGAAIAQGTNISDPHRRVRFSPIAAAEPHKLTFSHKTADAACGDYFWYNITQPNGLPLANPEQTYIHLIFAGGKTTQTGVDENPFIAQVSNGTQVAIDPSGYMLPGGQTTTGSCVASDVYYDPTKLAGGAAGPPILYPLCCTKYTGATGGFKVSGWSSTTFVCN